MDQPTQPERRRHHRIEKHFILSYFEKDDPEQKHNISQVKNISLGGICFIASRAYDRATKISLEVKTPYLDETVHLNGVVIESLEKIPNLIYEIHLAFENVAPEAEMILKKTINYFKENPHI